MQTHALKQSERESFIYIAICLLLFVILSKINLTLESMGIKIKIIEETIDLVKINVKYRENSNFILGSTRLIKK